MKKLSSMAIDSKYSMHFAIFFLAPIFLHSIKGDGDYRFSILEHTPPSYGCSSQLGLVERNHKMKCKVGSYLSVQRFRRQSFPLTAVNLFYGVLLTIRSFARSYRSLTIPNDTTFFIAVLKAILL